MKISCEVVEDLLPLYVDGVASEESRRLVEEHAAECENCRRLLEEMQKEGGDFGAAGSNRKRKKDSAKDGKPVMTDEVRVFLELRRKLWLKSLRVVLLVALAAAICVSAAWRGWNYYYYDKRTYLTWEESGLYVKDDQLYATKTYYGRMESVIAPNQVEEFCYMFETEYAKKEYPSKNINEKASINFAEQHNKATITSVDEDTGLPGLEKVYYVPPEAIKEAQNLWDFETDEEAEEKTKALEEKCLLIWSWDGEESSK